MPATATIAITVMLDPDEVANQALAEVAEAIDLDLRGYVSAWGEVTGLKVGVTDPDRPQEEGPHDDRRSAPSDRHGSPEEPPDAPLA